jgi:hypothetical protein
MDLISESQVNEVIIPDSAVDYPYVAISKNFTIVAKGDSPSAAKLAATEKGYGKTWIVKSNKLVFSEE